MKNRQMEGHGGLIMDSGRLDAPAPVRVYSQATEEGGLAGLASLSVPGCAAPILSGGRAEEKLHGPSPYAEKIYVFGMYAAEATIAQLRDGLRGREVISFVANEAACSALNTRPC